MEDLQSLSNEDLAIKERELFGKVKESQATHDKTVQQWSDVLNEIRFRDQLKARGIKQ